MWCTCCGSSGVEVIDQAFGQRSKYACDDDGDEGQELSSYRQFPPVHSDGVMSVAPITPGVCLSGSKDQKLVAFDFNQGIPVQQWSGHEKEVTKVLYSSVLHAYLSASRDKTVCLWKDATAQPAVTFQGHDLVVTGLSLNPEHSQICTGSRDNSVRLWDVHTGECVNQNTISRNLISHIKWSVDGSIIGQTGEDKEVKIWDAVSLQPSIKFPRKQYIQTCCDLSDDNFYCLTCSNGFGGTGCEASLWDIRTKGLVCEYKGHQETVGACVYLPKSLTRGRKLFATCSNDCSVRVWDQETKECVAQRTLSGSGPLTSIAPFEDGSLCVSSLNMGVYVLKLEETSNGQWILQHTAQY